MEKGRRMWPWGGLASLLLLFLYAACLPWLSTSFAPEFSDRLLEALAFAGLPSAIGFASLARRFGKSPSEKKRHWHLGIQSGILGCIELLLATIPQGIQLTSSSSVLAFTALGLVGGGIAALFLGFVSQI